MYTISFGLVLRRFPLETWFCHYCSNTSVFATTKEAFLVPACFPSAPLWVGFSLEASVLLVLYIGLLLLNKRLYFLLLIRCKFSHCPTLLLNLISPSLEMRSFTKYILLLSCLLALAAAQSSLPIVDLGYQLHQASSFNVGLLHWLSSMTYTRLYLVSNKVIGDWWFLQFLKYPVCRGANW